MSDITIVTAFFDIGRGNWTQAMQQRGGPLPHYLQRSADTYIERFAHLCQLDNELIIYTSEQYADRLKKIRDDLGKGDRTQIVVVDYPTEFNETRAKIRAVMDDPTFPPKINPHQIRNPEYWSEDYVMVTSLKAHFVADAVERGLCSNDTVAWIDFGYCRTPEALNGKSKWTHEFTPDKIHFFNCKPVDHEHKNEQMIHAVVNNDVIIFGAMVVAQKKFWRPLADGMRASLELLIQNGLVDDDQGLWLMCYFGNPNIFELHKIDYNDPFIVFRDYND